MKIYITFLFFVISAFTSKADYNFVNSPVIESGTNGTVLVTASGKRYPLKASSLKDSAGKAIDDNFFLSSESSGDYTLIGTLTTVRSFPDLAKLFPELTSEDSVSFGRLSSFLENELLQDTSVHQSNKFRFLLYMSRLIKGSADWERVFISISRKLGDMHLQDAIIPALCRNGKVFVSSLSRPEALSNALLAKIVSNLSYNEMSRGLFVEALSRDDAVVKFAALDQLRGGADRHIVTQLREAALAENPKLQWAAFMCLGTALEISVEAPSLKQYLASPTKWRDELAKELLK